MLHLKRNGRFNELYKCRLSGEFIAPGDYYYEDDEDGVIIKATVYKKLKEEREKELFDYSRLERATSEREYEQLLLQAEREFLTANVFERKIAGKE